MAKKKMLKIRAIKKEVVKNKDGISETDKAKVFDLLTNESLMRSTLLNKLIDDRRDIDNECGYPKSLTSDQYKIMYDREGVATRVVSIYPEESWVVDPEIVESEGSKDTVFEGAWKDLQDDKNIYSYLYKIDEISGIGQFGIILLGINDGKDLDQPVQGLNPETGEKTGKATYELLYLRVFDQTYVDISDTEDDVKNPRYGMPKYYTITFDSNTNTRSSTDGVLKVSKGKDQKVHWTRIIHIADNRKNSEVFGVPRMQTLFNRLYDLRKICGGSGEMFWKGGFPGYAFEMDANAKPLTTDQKTELKNEIAEFANGLQRYLTTQGIKTNSLEPQVADPGDHVEVMYSFIAITLGVPKRIFMGAEQAKLASTQDSKNWNKRVKRRQNKYLSPYVIKPFIERMIAFGILPEPKDKYRIIWPDLDSPSEKDKADVLKTKVEAYAKYIKGEVDHLIPPEIFFKMFDNLTEEEIKEITKASKEQIEEEERLNKELMDDEFTEESIDEDEEENEE